MLETIASPHDILLKDLLQHKTEAIAFFEKFLDSKIVELINLQTLESQNISYVSPDLDTKFSDIVFKVKLKNAQNLYLSILIEHKSAPDKYTCLQILRYIVEAHNKQIKENKSLELILPVLFYHGKENWKYKTIKDLLSNYPSSFMRFVPNFDVFNINLKSYPQQELAQIRAEYLSACMQVMNADTPSKAKKGLREIVKRHKNFEDGEQILKIIRYLYTVSEIKMEEIIEIIEDLPSTLNNKFMTAYEQTIEIGEKRGIEKGIEKGIEEGIEKEQRIVVINGFKNNLSVSLISNIIGLEEARVIAILKENGLV